MQYNAITVLRNSNSYSVLTSVIKTVSVRKCNLYVSSPDLKLLSFLKRPLVILNKINTMLTKVINAFKKFSKLKIFMGPGMGA